MCHDEIRPQCVSGQSPKRIIVLSSCPWFNLFRGRDHVRPTGLSCESLNIELGAEQDEKARTFKPALSQITTMHAHKKKSTSIFRILVLSGWRRISYESIVRVFERSMAGLLPSTVAPPNDFTQKPFHGKRLLFKATLL